MICSETVAKMQFVCSMMRVEEEEEHVMHEWEWMRRNIGLLFISCSSSHSSSTRLHILER